VVLDIATGDVLAMVSVPSFNHRQLASGDTSAIFGDTYAQAYLNRAIDQPYPPGSIVKPVILASAITAGKYSPNERIACTGHFFPDKPLIYRCWIYKQNHTTHTDQLGHDLNGSDAVKVSCNIFFFEMGKRLGPQGIHDLFTRFGVGAQAERWNLFGPPESGEEDAPERALIAEYPGSVPDPVRATLSEAILMGIGQGPILWTPMHAADAYATLARGGVKLTPRVRSDAKQGRTDLGLDPRGIQQAMEGLKRCANEEMGTTHTITFETADGAKTRENVFTVPGVDIWAKSGTADAPPFIADLDFNGANEAFDGDHAWCVLLAGVGGEPKYAVAVVVDHGGSGGKVAGPVANQVVYALASEGYLPNLKPAAAPAHASAGEARP
jgi:penicillin-binding protein 2